MCSLDSSASMQWCLCGTLLLWIAATLTASSPWLICLNTSPKLFYWHSHCKLPTLMAFTDRTTDIYCSTENYTGINLLYWHLLAGLFKPLLTCSHQVIRSWFTNCPFTRSWGKRDTRVAPIICRVKTNSNRCKFVSVCTIIIFLNLLLAIQED